MVQGTASQGREAVFGEVTDLQQMRGVHIKVEKNSRGYNWSCSYHGETIDEALAGIDRLVAELKRRFPE